MKRLLAFALLASLAGAAQADPAAVFKSKCALCHGAAGKGTKLAPTPIAGAAADVAKKAITEGKGTMKPVKVDDPDGVAAHVAGLPK